MRDFAAITAAMKDVRFRGNRAAHHLRGDIYEVRVHTGNRRYRILYATEGRSDQVLLSLHAFAKKTGAVRVADIDLAEQRLRDWRSRRRPS